MLDSSQTIPWAWYVTRSSGLVGFLLLYISVLLGLLIRVPYLRKLVPGWFSLQMHCWLSLLALMFALVHGTALLFDKMFDFSFGDIFIPFYTSYEKDLMALGIIGFYLMLLLVATSYLKNGISQNFWRAAHFLNIGMYFILIIHALYLGTDMKIAWVRDIFLGMQGVLIFFIILHIFSRIICRRKTVANSECEIPQQ